MIDRFGQLPKEVNNLLEVMRIKQKCLQAGVSKIDAGPKGIVLSFHNDTFKNPEALIQYISKNPLKTKIRSDQKLVLLNESNSEDERLRITRNSLDNIIKLAA